MSCLRKIARARSLLLPLPTHHTHITLYTHTNSQLYGLLGK